RELLLTESKQSQPTRMGMGSLINFAKLGHLRRRLKLVSQDREGPGKPAVFAPDQLASFKQVLREAQRTIRSWDGSLYFVYLPARDRYASNEGYQRELVLRAVADLGLPIIDIHPVFQAKGDPLNLFPFRRFGHYNQEGHRVVAKAVLQTISLSQRGDM
ncbi:MAG TPA: hypothetical protein VJ044_11870, partial [Candidatus Hodarchaeales archaeon]|nr:hypothetical protein [Candidatus Hodarchaeales archaeon]